MTSQDVITFKQESLKLIKADEYFIEEIEEEKKDKTTGKKIKTTKTIKHKLSDFLYNEKVAPIISILRERPMTIKELVQAYNIHVEKPKKEMTIYRYVKLLEKASLVAQVGRRVSMKKTATEILYGRTAKLFYPLALSEDFWITKSGADFVGTVGKLLSLYTEKEEGFPEDDLVELLDKIYTEIDNEMGKFLEKNTEQVSKIFAGKSFYEIEKLLSIFSNILLVLNPSFYEEEWKKCFID